MKIEIFRRCFPGSNRVNKFETTSSLFIPCFEQHWIYDLSSDPAKLIRTETFLDIPNQHYHPLPSTKIDCYVIVGLLWPLSPILYWYCFIARDRSIENFLLLLALFTVYILDHAWILNLCLCHQGQRLSTKYNIH